MNLEMQLFLKVNEKFWDENLVSQALNDFQIAKLIAINGNKEGKFDNLPLMDCIVFFSRKWRAIYF